MPTETAAKPGALIGADFAPAKINLCLHVTGRRANGYHLLDSLVVFAGVGDRVAVTPDAASALQIDGPEAAGLMAEADNLVLRAAQAMQAPDARLHLWKALPVASGIGGGSADAAAALRALARWTGRPLPDPAAVLALGADVPVCLAGRPARMEGVGDLLTPLPPLPGLWCLLVNPRVPVPTRQVFAALDRRDNGPIPALPVKGWTDAPAFATWLSSQTRNDLVAAARSIAPILDQVQAEIAATDGCLFARMSGSGGTHFGLFATPQAARQAEETLRAARPGWWIVHAPVLEEAGQK